MEGIYNISPLIEKEKYLTLQSNIQAFYKKYPHYKENTFAIEILYNIYMIYHQKTQLYVQQLLNNSIKQFYEMMFDFYFMEYDKCIYLYHKKILSEALEHIATILTDYS